MLNGPTLCSKVNHTGSSYSAVACQFKLFKPRARLLARYNVFSIRIIDQWNALPPEVINSQSISEFKRKLDLFWSETGHGHN